MGKFGFDNNDEPSVDISGLRKKNTDRPRKKVMEDVKSDLNALGYVDRSPKASVKKTKRKPGRKPPSEPKRQIMISGPEGVIEGFKEYCEQNGNIPYWRGIQILMED